MKTDKIGKRRIERLLLTVGIALIVAALLLFAGLNYFDSARSSRDQEIVARLGAVIPSLQPGVSDHYADKEAAMSAVNIEGIGYIGILQIPSQDRTIPVAESPQGKGVYRISGNAKASTLLIGSSGWLYEEIADLNVGDTLSFVDVRGNVWELRVWKQLRLSANSSIEFVESADLTLAVKCKDATILIGCLAD